MDVRGFKELIEGEFGAETVLAVNESSTPHTIEVDVQHVARVLAFLQANDQTYFDMLSCLTAIDNGTAANTMEVIYNLYSIPLEHSLMIKVTLDREKPEIDSVVHLWRAADWHEREAFDLFGVKFLNHPDLRRILMPDDWEGHPMREGYIEPEEYRGMKTIREEEDPS